VTAAPLEIRKAAETDHDEIWKIFREVIVAGDTYAIDPGISRPDALALWFRDDTHTFVAELDRLNQPSSESARRVVGSYFLKPNQAGAGSHVANAAFIVASGARGQGVGRAMAEHCLTEAQGLGFRAMQFNFVVSTNQSAIRLWRQLGFNVVGTLPGAFRHLEKGFVDVHVMFRSLLQS
jgi:ribosomal protein S18 acetylase RimI-like enzyme